MAYSSITKPSLHFNTKLTTGTGSSQAVTGVGFQPDWIWGKRRDSSGNHSLFDSVRGITKGLESNSTGAEFTSTDYYSSFDSDGFTIAAGSSGAGNGNSQTAVQWCWKANGAGSSNSDGDITSTVSANQTAGFSIVKYTGNGSNDQRVGHGLGARPTAWFIKRLDSADDWIVYHQGLATNWYDDTYLYLNSTNAVMGQINAGTGNPTSSVFYIGDTGRTGASGDDYIAYVFAEKKGYSKFGQYTGTGSGSSGAFIYTGFKPAWVMIKPRSFANGWAIFDNKRPGFNVTNDRLEADGSSAESDSLDYLDLLSNGFRIRTSNAHLSNNGETLIYMAFAAEPLVANVGQGIPATAF